MLIFKHRQQMQNYLRQLSNAHIGFVPTMGALHAGHLSLIQTCKQQCTTTVCSIYVNPTQFNNKTDFDKYPLTPQSDIDKLYAAGCDVLYMPDTEDIYGDTLPQQENYDLGFLDSTLEAAHRPGHFQGVCMVVKRLLQAVQPHTLFLGQKDYQQVMVIRRLIKLMSLDIEVVSIPTLREPDGLAMSSRNMRLTPEQHTQATVIYKVLLHIKEQYSKKSTDDICTAATELINATPYMRTEYVALRDADTLSDIVINTKHVVALIAAFCGDVRLIDNLVIT